MKKVGTSECKLFVAAHYAQKRQDTMDDDWDLVRKYRNPKGNTCRDFHCEMLNINAIVEVLPDENMQGYKLHVIEGADQHYFFDEMLKRPAYLYVPGVSNDGLVFYFENVFRLERNQQLETEPGKYKPVLIKRLKECFGEKAVCDLKAMTVTFPKHDFEQVIRILEKNGFSYHPQLYELLGDNITAFYPDMSMILFEFPEYRNIDMKVIEQEIFKVLSESKEITVESYARIKSLIKKMNLSHLQKVQPIALSFRPDDKKLLTIFEAEKSKKQAQQFWLQLMKN